MKVIDGGFGKEMDASKTPLERLREQLEKAELEGVEGEYLLLFDTGTALVMLSNLQDPADVVMMTEKAKMAVLMSQLGGPPEPMAS
jgi:hypothetical protein